MPAKPTAQSHLARLESSELRAEASRIAGFKLRKPEFGSAANISGLRDATFVFSRRLDCRTLFAADSRYGPQRKLGAWTGADKSAISTCRRILRAAGVPSAEIPRSWTSLSNGGGPRNEYRKTNSSASSRTCCARFRAGHTSGGWHSGLEAVREPWPHRARRRRFA